MRPTKITTARYGPERRLCKRTESKVNVGIIFQQMFGHEAATAYLNAAGVPEHVTVRVLTWKARSRQIPA